ncbi:hypothetical protein KJ359_011373 [Pestalotiopsis sp. 9143b]|nr:hypothetical protein KJ359_011373 [Pestalotiopsis sp. 9143b]
MKFTPVLFLLLGNMATLGSALPEPAPFPVPAPAPEPIAQAKPVPTAKVIGAVIPILPPVDLPNPLSLLTLFGTCVTGCVEVSIAKYTSCVATPTTICVCPHMKNVLAQAAPCFKTCNPNNLLSQSIVLAAVACKIKGVASN